MVRRSQVYCTCRWAGTVHSTRWNGDISQNIAISACPTCIRRPPLEGFPLEYCHDVWYSKTRMVWLRGVEHFWRYDYSFRQNPRTWQTDERANGETPHDGIGHAYASRGEKDCARGYYTDTKHRAASLRQQSFLIYMVIRYIPGTELRLLRHG